MIDKNYFFGKMKMLVQGALVSSVVIGAGSSIVQGMQPVAAPHSPHPHGNMQNQDQPPRINKKKRVAPANNNPHNPNARRRLNLDDNAPNQVQYNAPNQVKSQKQTD